MSALKAQRSLEIGWNLAERWFRVVEFSIILGFLNFAVEKSGNPYVKIIYWISNAAYFGIFSDLWVFIAVVVGEKKKFVWKFIIFLLVGLLTLAIPIVAVQTSMILASMN